jgi:hypothetical protein
MTSGGRFGRSDLTHAHCVNVLSGSGRLVRLLLCCCSGCWLWRPYGSRRAHTTSYSQYVRATRTSTLSTLVLCCCVACCASRSCFAVAWLALSLGGLSLLTRSLALPDFLLLVALLHSHVFVCCAQCNACSTRLFNKGRMERESVYY